MNYLLNGAAVAEERAVPPLPCGNSRKLFEVLDEIFKVVTSS